ncbi:M36 family metallopeptidase [Pendulispora brunnea]|uniref:M36 family metallopeptidase n=1 Tax=Pendulispora brunnea TaxID=2905690 RepID=A0ABZ2JYX5_9BACT
MRVRSLGPFGLRCLVPSLVLAASACSGHEPPGETVSGAIPDPALRVQIAHRNGEEPTFLLFQGGTASDTPRLAATRALETAREALRLEPAALRATQIVGVEPVAGGATIVRFGQSVNGIEIFGRKLATLLDSAGRPIAMSGRLAPSVAMDAMKPPQGELATPVARAAARITGARPEDVTVEAAGPAAGGYRSYRLSPGNVGRGRAKDVLFASGKRLIPAEYVEVANDAGTDARSFVVSKEDGAILFEQSLIVSDTYAYRVWSNATAPVRPYPGPQGDAFMPHPTGMPGFPIPEAPVASNLVSLANVPFSKNDPWLPAGATETTGNNVLAYADIVAPDGFSAGDLSATTTESGRFDRVYAPEANATADENRRIGITHGFFVMNFLHDWFYDAGYTEAAGNSQRNNFGRGGLPNDPVLFETQDFSGRNNANALTPADGQSPRVQMYLFQNGTVARADIKSPPAVAGSITVAPARFGPQTVTVAGTLAFLDVDACNGTAIPATVAGRVAVVGRAGCEVTQKVRNLEASGARAVLIAEAQDGAPQRPTGFDFTGIPAVAIGRADVTRLRAVEGGVDMELRLEERFLDGALDTSIVAHEWGHTLSNRLVFDAHGLINRQGRSMGEGWSDFVAQLVLVRPEDDHTGPGSAYTGTYAPGVYAGRGVYQDFDYFGVRRVPYSTDMAKNALTFQHIELGVPLPKTHPVASWASELSNNEAHNAGEIWANVLWECYAALLRDRPRLSFDEAQSRMKKYLVASLSLTPSEPTFVEARDALLAAAQAVDAADLALFKAAFAKRGLGAGARAPERSDGYLSGVVESFANGPLVRLVGAALEEGATSCDHDGIVDQGEDGVITLRVRNDGWDRSQPGRAVVQVSGLTLVEGDSVAIPELMPGETVTKKVPVRFRGTQSPSKVEVQAKLEGPSTDGTQATTLHPTVNCDLGPSVNDPFATATSLWFDEPNLPTWAHWHYENRGDGYAWTVKQNTEGGSAILRSPLLVVDNGGRLSFDLEWRYDLGTMAKAGVLLLREGGPYYEDIQVQFAGRSAAYPASTTSHVDVPGVHPGEKVHVAIILRSSWPGHTKLEPGTAEIRGVRFQGIANQPFSGAVDQRARCNQPPTASATAPARVTAGAQVALHGEGTDPDGDALTYAWQQVSGPRVAIDGATAKDAHFVAPEVAGELRLRLTVSDGVAAGAPAEVVVRVDPRSSNGDGGAPGEPLEPNGGDGGCSAAPQRNDGSLTSPWMALGLAAMSLVRRSRRRRAQATT